MKTIIHHSLSLALCAFLLSVAAATTHLQTPAKVEPVKAQRSETGDQRPAASLPPLPAGVTELKFSEFFVSPIGPRGLTLTEKLRSLDGKRVRILGYMAQQEQPAPGMFLFNAIPVRLNEEHYGLADDLPAATLFVSMPKDRGQVVRYTPEMMLLTGTLSLGNREEADGRISTVRLALEAPAAASEGGVSSNQCSVISLAAPKSDEGGSQLPVIRRAK